MLQNVLSSIHRVTDELYMKKLFGSEVTDHANRKLLRVKIEVLRKYLRKTIIRYTLEFDDSSTASCIGLHRESDKRLQRAFARLHLLRSKGFGEDSNLRVPEPILYSPALSLLLVNEAEGKTLRSVLAEQGNGTGKCVEGAARWIAKLHLSNVNFDNTRVQQEEILDSLRYRHAAIKLFPALESKMQYVSQHLINAQGKLPHVPLSPIHGDYHPRNVISSPNVTTVVDFDEARMGDPAFDLGYFSAQTKMTHGFKAAIDRATSRFLEDYQNGLCFHTDLERRAKVWEAQTYFQRIYHSFFLLGLKPDYGMVSEWLTESEMCLDAARWK